MIGCGGAGINIANEAYTRLHKLGNGFSSVKDFYIDTSVNNFTKFNLDKSKIFNIEGLNTNQESIQGSGGIRKTHASVIGNQIPDVTTSFGFNKNETDNYYIVFFSTAGGSGSVIGPLLIKSLLEKEMNVIAVFVGDSDDGVSVENTLGTIKTLNHISKVTKTTLSCHYIDNSNSDSVTKTPANLTRINEEITSFMVVLSIFLSGKNDALDNQDMNNLINMSAYSTWDIQPGLYLLAAHSGSIKKIAESTLMMGRTLVNNDVEDTVIGDFLSYKVGTVPTTDIGDKLGNNNFPLCLTVEGNYFPHITTQLNARLEKWKKDLAIINDKSSIIEGADLDDNGLIF